MAEIGIVDTTIRDGQASLWAMNMRTRHMLPAMPHLDAAGFDSMEFLAHGSRLKKFVRHLKENPWDWIHEGVKAAKHTPLRWHGLISGGSSMSGYVPDEVGELLVRKVAELGIRYVRTGNNWNDFSVIGPQAERYRRLGLTAIVNVMYSVSPRHTNDYYVQKARDAAAIEPFRLCFKDVSGLLTPERVRELLPMMMKETGDIPWEFHGHCNNGFGPVNALEAAKAGARYIHTAVPPLANANSQPSVYNVVANLRALGFDVPLDERRLEPATEHLTYVARREGFTLGVPWEYDERLYRHQVPGGMISNLRYQLRLAGVEDRLDEVLEETAQVRADFGYPIMVTPLSQFVGSQAAVNVIVGERYRQVTDKAIEYALGQHGGEEATAHMDEDVRAKILDRPRARELQAQRPPEPTLRELRRKYGPQTSDEDLILMAIVGDDAVDVVGRARDPRSHAMGSMPVTRLVEELTKSTGWTSILVEKGSFSLKAERSGATDAAAES
jgi:oxaloacetate decarboxylase (Na+ extruding) subunit alpha